MDDRYDAVMTAMGMDIFEDRRPHVTGYKLIMPGLAIGGHDLPVAFGGGQWVVQQDEVGHHFVGRGDSQLEAIIEIIRQRAGQGHECNAECE